MFTSIFSRPFRSSSLALLTFSCLTSLGLAGPLLEYEGPVNAMSQGEVAARVQIANNITRDRSSNGTLWIRFSTEVTAYLSSDKENAGGMFGGLQLLRDGQENLGVGKNISATAWSFYRAGGMRGSAGNGDFLSPHPTADAGYERIKLNEVHHFVVRIDYHADGDDTAVVYMDPVFAKGFGHGSRQKGTLLPIGDYSFNEIHVRCGYGDAAMTFSGILIAERWEDLMIPSDKHTIAEAPQP